jgi:hypothetical protein
MTVTVNLNRIQWNGFEDFSWELPLSGDFNMLLAGAFKWTGPLQCLNDMPSSSKAPRAI